RTAKEKKNRERKRKFRSGRGLIGAPSLADGVASTHPGARGARSPDASRQCPRPRGSVHGTPRASPGHRRHAHATQAILHARCSCEARTGGGRVTPLDTARAGGRSCLAGARIGVWPGADVVGARTPAARAMLVYNPLIASYLVYLAAVGVAGILLWPAVAEHGIVTLLFFGAWRNESSPS